MLDSGLLGTLVVVGTLGMMPSRLAAEPIEIARVSHVDQQLVLFDTYDRRFVLRDGKYSNPSGVDIHIRGGRIAEIVGCGPKPCRIGVHATRIMGGKLSVYSEIQIPDGAYTATLKSESGDEVEVHFRVLGGKMIELDDSGQVGSTPVDQASPETKPLQEVAP